MSEKTKARKAEQPLRHADGTQMTSQQVAAVAAARSERNPHGVVFSFAAQRELGALVGNLLVGARISV